MENKIYSFIVILIWALNPAVTSAQYFSKVTYFSLSLIVRLLKGM